VSIFRTATAVTANGLFGLCETGKILEFYLINKFNPLFGKPGNNNPNRKAKSNNH